MTPWQDYASTIEKQKVANFKIQCFAGVIC